MATLVHLAKPQGFRKQRFLGNIKAYLFTALVIQEIKGANSQSVMKSGRVVSTFAVLVSLINSLSSKLQYNESTITDLSV